MIEKILVLLVVCVVALMFFGNRLPQVLGDLGKGIRAFKEGMNDGGEGDETPVKKSKPKANSKPASKTVKRK